MNLPNRTTAELSHPGSGYLIVLTVFHNLHCLDSIRKALYYFVDDTAWNATCNPYVKADAAPIDTALWAFGGRDVSIKHVDHCIDALRQSVMCTSDITPNVFQWTSHERVEAHATVVHQCRDLDKVRQIESIKSTTTADQVTADQGMGERTSCGSFQGVYRS